MTTKYTHQSELIEPGSFESPEHFYPRVLNATLHPVVSSFLNLNKERLLKRYCHLHPGVEKEALRRVLNYVPRHFFWAGGDLFHVTNEEGTRQVIVIETNSCPSGQKSMPMVSDNGDLDEQSGYTRLSRMFHDTVKSKENLPEGGIVVIYDKNPMEAKGYACKIADMFGENVYMVEFYNNDPNPCVRWEGGVLVVRNSDDEWIPMKAAFRYVTQQPWNRFPLEPKTFVFNSILSCLCGGRNKLVASKAYEFYNSELVGTGLQIRTPATMHDVRHAEIPIYVKSMGYCAVVKNPYSNAGQGVWTITSKDELNKFMEIDQKYDKFIVQALVGNSSWSSKVREHTFYHCGTVPNRKNDTYVCDIRMMVGASPDGFEPLAIYARRASKPLSETLEDVNDSWPMLGTNLSVKKGENEWSSDSSRLVLMDRKDFNTLGISIDELIDGYVQTVLAAIAIDKMANRIWVSGEGFNLELFSSLNDDPILIAELNQSGNWKCSDGVVVNDA